MKNIIVNSIVIVVDNSNYKSHFAEDVPFKAIVTRVFDTEVWVKSIVTNKEYELYESQLLEGLSNEEIKNLIDLSKYGE